MLAAQMQDASTGGEQYVEVTPVNADLMQRSGGAWASTARLASAISIESDIIRADQHGAIGFEPSSVQLLGSSEFYQLPVRPNIRASAGSERSPD